MWFQRLLWVNRVRRIRTRNYQQNVIDIFIVYNLSANNSSIWNIRDNFPQSECRIPNATQSVHNLRSTSERKLLLLCQL